MIVLKIPRRLPWPNRAGSTRNVHNNSMAEDKKKEKNIINSQPREQLDLRETGYERETG